MALRYRKRIKIAPGVYVNVSNSGVSTTVGPKGARVNIGKNGTYLNTSIPGTGLYSRQKISGGNRSHSASSGNYGGYDNSGCYWFVAIFIVVNAFFLGLCNLPAIATVLLAIIVTFVLWLIVISFTTKNSQKEDTVNTEVEADEESDPAITTLTDEVAESANRSSKMFLLSWKRDNFDLMQSEALALYDFLKSATRSIKVRRELDRMMALTNNDGSAWEVKDKITLTMLLDAYRCYTWLGYDIDLKQNEELGLMLFANQISTPGFYLEYDQIQNYQKQVMPTVRNMFDTVIRVNDNCPIPEGQFFFQHVFENVAPERMSEYMVRLYRFASAIAKADDTITEKESDRLAALMKAKDLTTDGKPLILHTNNQKVNEGTDNNKSLYPSIAEIARAVIESQNTATSYIQRRFSIGFNRAGKIMDELEGLGVVGPVRNGMPRELLCHSLGELEKLLKGKEQFIEVQKEDIEAQKDDNPQLELQSLIGLASVKEEVEKLTNFIKIMKVRKAQGLPISDISYHCVFTGNPGTGKTTVARIIANIYRELGVIKSGHLVETDRSGLVAEYIGQTAVKTNKIIDSALDGVLFIDEAYSLATGSSNDYGSEAISTLLKRMEDDRSRLVVILAGYGNEMNTFINSNPGLQSRFSRYIHFPDYDAEELFSIYSRNLKKHKYTLDEEAAKHIKALLATAVANKDKNFGNARFVRNLFEKTLENQAMRLAGIGKLTNEMLCTITLDDVLHLR